MSDWGGYIASAKIEGYWMNGPWVITNPYAFIDKVNQNSKWFAGDGECVAIAQWTMEMPLTDRWRPGLKVLGNGTPNYYSGHEVFGSGIVPGTAIATFVDKMYLSKITGNHVAIY